MAWFSSSSSSSSSAQQSKNTQQTPTPTTTTPLSPQLQPDLQPKLPVQPSPQPKDLDADFHSAFPHLAPTPSSSPTAPNTPTPLAAGQTTSTSDLSSYPTTMSCRAAFDSAFYCSSFGGHFNDIYRYGQLRSCSEHWADWRFCMGLKGKSREKSEELVQDRYRDKEERVRGRPNSEDVWRRRGPDEKIVGAFYMAEEERGRVEGV